MTDREKVQLLKEKIKEESCRTITLMEVCGTHTMSIAANGIRSLLPAGIRLISGPGCPVCVTSQSDIEKALELARKKDVIITTFGDMVRVPSRGDRLENYRNVQIVYSPMESLKIAEDNRDKEVIFLGVGFETTAPLIASTIEKAYERELTNFSVLSLHKTVPEALKLILSERDCMIDGLILPGHVSAVTGSSYFDFLKERECAGVITAFDAVNIMESIYIMSRMLSDEKQNIVNNYQSVVTEQGNREAMILLEKVFESCDAHWRGIGLIKNSGLKIRQKYSRFDSEQRFTLQVKDVPDPSGCLCGSILLGKSMPSQCGHFGKNCTPADPIGPCMVSSEGTCAAWYKYGTGETANE